MKINFDQYLHRGYIWDMSYSEPVSFSEMSFEDSKEELYRKMDEEVEKILNLDGKVLWTMSSGLDTSSMLSHVMKRTNEIDTVCLDNGRLDPYMSTKLAEEWGIKNHKVVEIESDKIEEYLLEMNHLYRTPVAHTYLFFSYYLFKYAQRMGYDYVIMGDGPDVSMLGTYDLHSDLITEAIALNEYNVNLAKEVLDNSKYIEYCAVNPSIYLIHAYKIRNIEKYNDTFFYALWPSEPYAPKSPKMEFRNNNLRHRLWAEWEQFMIRTREPTEWFLNEFSFKQISPYINMNDFIMSLRPEYRFVFGSTKHIMRETYGDYLPDYIINKERTGFNPNDNWASRYKNVIDGLLDKYWKNKNRKIHWNLGFPHEPVTFNQKWAIINLSMWMEQF